MVGLIKYYFKNRRILVIRQAYKGQLEDTKIKEEYKAAVLNLLFTTDSF